jgi:hypothetical protein
LAVLASAATPAFAEDPADVIIQHVEAVETPADVEAMILSMPAPEAASTELEEGIDWAAIINLGKEVWKVIEENAPVVNIKYDYATALPRGISDAGQLDGFSDVVYQSYRMYGTNGFGMTVYDVTYTLVHQYGGSYEGKGAYLATASIIPSNVDVLWGYTVDLNVNNVSTLNVGSADAPVGSVSMEMSFKVSTVIKSHTSTTLYQFRGDTHSVRATDL